MKIKLFQLVILSNVAGLLLFFGGMILGSNIDLKYIADHIDLSDWISLIVISLLMLGYFIKY